MAKHITPTASDVRVIRTSARCYACRIDGGQKLSYTSRKALIEAIAFWHDKVMTLQVVDQFNADKGSMQFTSEVTTNNVHNALRAAGVKVVTAITVRTVPLAFESGHKIPWLNTAKPEAPKVAAPPAKQEPSDAVKALLTLVCDNATGKWLAENNPQGLMQAEAACGVQAAYNWPHCPSCGAYSDLAFDAVECSCGCTELAPPATPAPALLPAAITSSPYTLQELRDAFDAGKRICVLHEKDGDGSNDAIGVEYIGREERRIRQERGWVRNPVGWTWQELYQNEDLRQLIAPGTSWLPYTGTSTEYAVRPGLYTYSGFGTGTLYSGRSRHEKTVSCGPVKAREICAAARLTYSYLDTFANYTPTALGDR